MTEDQCDYPHCTNEAKEKCGICGDVYCVRHIQLGGIIYVCDICIAAANLVEELKAAKARAERVRVAAEKEAVMAETLARLKAERLKREENRKKRRTLAWVGASLIACSLLIVAVITLPPAFQSSAFQPGTQPAPFPLAAGVVVEILFLLLSRLERLREAQRSTIL